MVGATASAGIAAGQTYMRLATAQELLALQGCVVTYTPNSAGYREANSCAPAPVNAPPVVEVGGPYASVEGQPVELSGSAIDENGDALTYDWSIGDGTNKNGNPVSHSFVDNGNYPATLAVSDGELVTLVTTRVDVSNALPSLGALEAATRFIGEAYDISVPLSDAGVLDAPWRYSIEWGDGVIDEGDATSLAEPIRGSHSWVDAGTYTVRVTLRDKDEGVATAVEAQVVVKLDESDIDVKPWDSKNRIHLKGHWDKHIPVAILSDARLDAATIDLSTVKLGNVSVRQWHRESNEVGFGRGTRNLTYLAVMFDIDNDGDRDLLVLFDRKEMVRAGELTPETSGLTLTALTVGGGRKIVGTDVVQIVR
jgi:PKD domain